MATRTAALFDPPPQLHCDSITPPPFVFHSPPRPSNLQTTTSRKKTRVETNTIECSIRSSREAPPPVRMSCVAPLETDLVHNGKGASAHSFKNALGALRHFTIQSCRRASSADTGKRRSGAVLPGRCAQTQVSLIVICTLSSRRTWSHKPRSTHLSRRRATRRAELVQTPGQRWQRQKVFCLVQPGANEPFERGAGRRCSP